MHVRSSSVFAACTGQEHRDKNERYRSGRRGGERSTAQSNSRDVDRASLPYEGTNSEKYTGEAKEKRSACAPLQGSHEPHIPEPIARDTLPAALF